MLNYETIEDLKLLILIEETIKKFNYDPNSLGRHSSQKICFKCVVCGLPFINTKKRVLDKKGITHPGPCRDILRSINGKKARQSEHPSHKEFRKLKLREKIASSGPSIVTKRRKTTLEKYGVEHHSQDPTIYKKMQVKIKEAYQTRREEIINQRRQTNLEKYGSINFLTSELGKEIIHKSNQQKYGTNYPFQAQELRSKFPQILLEKYGVENAQQIPENRQRLKKWCEENPEKLFTSKAEQEIKDWIRTFYPSATKHRQDGQEMDIFIPELKIGIEYNGLFWHSESTKVRTYHLEKTKHFQQLGIRIIHIFEHEWRDKKHQVQSYILSAISKNSIKLSPRNCNIVWSSSKKEINLAHQLLDDYHIQGHTRSTKYVANVYHNEELVATATFGKHHRNGEQWVLSRFCTRYGHTVRGLLGKISKLAYSNLQQPIISWADYRLSQGNGYERSGWKFKELLPPDYFYFKISTSQIISKQSRQKKIVKTPKEMTEIEHAHLDGLERIWDCGKIRYSYSPTNNSQQQEPNEN